MLATAVLEIVARESDQLITNVATIAVAPGAIDIDAPQCHIARIQLKQLVVVDRNSQF